VAVFSEVHGGTLPPAEHEVAQTGAHEHGQTQPHVVRHEHQHQQVRYGELEHVQDGLEQVVGAEQRHPVRHGALLYGEVRLAGRVLQPTGRFLEQVVPVELERLIQEGEHTQAKHRHQQLPDCADAPPLEEHLALAVPKVEVHLHDGGF